MKKLFTLMAVTALAIAASAQSPQKMSYQCVVRNSSGALVPNQAVGMKISILKGSATGTVVFAETYSPNPQTNANGLVTVEIGSGTASVGTFAGIDWSAGPYFLKTETDPAGGTTYTITGTSQLLSVPYALYAKTAANGFSGAWADITGKPAFATVATTGSYNDLLNKPALFSGSYNDLLNKPTLFSGSYNDLTNKPALFDGTWVSLTGKPSFATVATSGSYNDLLNRPALFSGAWADITGKPAGFADGIDNVDDADNSVTNEIQTLNLSGTTLSLSLGGGSVTLPSSGGGDNWGTQTVVTDATLAGNGTTPTPLRIADNGVTTIKIVNSAVTAEKLAASAVTTDKINAGAVTGSKIAQAGATNGQVLKWNNTTWAPANDATGEASLTLPYSGTVSNNGYAFSVTNTLLSAISGEASGGGIGVYGETNTIENGCGVYGKSTIGMGYGVYGLGAGAGTNWGVYGMSISQWAGIGVEGRADASEGPNIGVKGSAKSSSGYGVYGASPIYGVYGLSSGSQGRAVTGEATGTASIGVQGIATNTSSTGVWGEGANQGVYGVSALSTGKGILGVASSATGENSGVYGETNSNFGYGVYGIGPFNGVKGIANSTTLAGHGVFGVANSANGDGVMGYAASGTGVKGETGGVNKSGIYGLATSETGDNFGVTGQSRSSSGTGVLGYSPKFGVYGASTATTGRAVMGEAQGTSSIGVYGKALSDNSTGVYGEGANYDFYAAGPGVNYGNSSSVRWKRNIELIPQPLEKIKAIRGVYFDWDEDHGGQHDVGMIAEEVGKVLPEIVVYEENGIDANGMDYSKITPLLIEAIKEQQKQIDELKALVSKLMANQP